jgi:hypothetical protein
VNNILTDITNNKLGDVLTFVPNLESNKIINRLYDGSYQIQTIGSAGKYATVELFIYRATMDAINLAESRSDLLRVVYNEQTYLGYISEPIQWSPIIKGSAYQGTMKFLIEE